MHRYDRTYKIERKIKTGGILHRGIGKGLPIGKRKFLWGSLMETKVFFPIISHHNRFPHTKGSKLITNVVTTTFMTKKDAIAQN